MARYSHLPIYKSCYTLTREIFQLQEKLPKNLKFTIGTRLFDSCVKCVQGVIVANGSEEKLPHLKSVALEIEAIWMFIDNKTDNIGALSTDNQRIIDITQIKNLKTTIWLGFNNNFFEGLNHFEKVKKGADFLIKRGYQLDFISDEVGHKVGVSGMKALKSWLEQRLKPELSSGN